MNTIHIATSFDRAFVMPACVALHSALGRLRQSRPVCVHLLTTGVSEADARGLIRRLTRTKPDVTFKTYSLDGSPLVEVSHAAPHLTNATLLRLAIGQLFDGVDKVIYVDADCLVMDDIAELYDMPLDGAPMAAVRSVATPTIAAAHWLKGYPLPGTISPESEYFNAGILVIDAKQWREMDVFGNALGLFRDYGHLFHTADQDALNLLFAGRWKGMAGRWNFQVYPMLVAGRGRPAADLFPDPGILHFVGISKPWIRDFRNPFRGAYHEALRHSGWFLLPGRYAVWKAGWLGRCARAEVGKRLRVPRPAAN